MNHSWIWAWLERSVFNLFKTPKKVKFKVIWFVIVNQEKKNVWNIQFWDCIYGYHRNSATSFVICSQGIVKMLCLRYSRNFVSILFVEWNNILYIFQEDTTVHMYVYTVSQLERYKHQHYWHARWVYQPFIP